MPIESMRHAAILTFVLVLFGRGARANIGVGTSNPLAGLDVLTTGTASAIIVPRDNTTNRPAAGINGMIRYNTTANAFEGYANGAWMQFAQQAVGSTANVTASGPPVGANTYTASSIACNYTPGYGSCANLTNGVWPTNQSGNAGCINLPPDGTSRIVLDYGSNKTFGNIYVSAWADPGYTNLAIAFSTDNATYSNGLSFATKPGYYDTEYGTSALNPVQVARYIRIMNTSPNTVASNNYICQFAAGP